MPGSVAINDRSIHLQKMLLISVSISFNDAIQYHFLRNNYRYADINV